MSDTKPKQQITRVDGVKRSNARTVKKDDGTIIKRRMTKRSWAEAGALWETGHYTLATLSERYNVSLEYMSKRFKAMGLVKGRTADQQAEKIAKRIQYKEMKQIDVIAERARQTKENHYNWSRAIAQMTMQELANAKKEGRPPSTCYPNLKAYEKAISVLETSRKEQFAALGLDKGDVLGEDDLPELLVQEMTSEDVERIRNATQGGENDLDDLQELSSAGLEEFDEDDDDLNELVEEGAD